MLKKLRKINYNQFFSSRFQTATIDSNFQEVDNPGKAKLIGNVIDLLFYDQNQLKLGQDSQENAVLKKLSALDKQRKETHRCKSLGIRKMSKYEESIANDPKRITTYNAYFANISYAKLQRKNINISPSLGYQRPDNKIWIGGEQVRAFKKGEAKAAR